MASPYGTDEHRYSFISLFYYPFFVINIRKIHAATRNLSVRLVNLVIYSPGWTIGMIVISFWSEHEMRTQIHDKEVRGDSQLEIQV